MSELLIKEYFIESGELKLNVKILFKEGDFIKTYFLDIPEFGLGTRALIDNLKDILINKIQLKPEMLADQKFIAEIREKFKHEAYGIIEEKLGNLPNNDKLFLVYYTINEMLGLGNIEFLLDDPNAEEIAINSSKEPIWIYHKEFGWLKTNLFVKNEADVYNYSTIIARRVGKQITILSPLLDAHLPSGDRANATLFPISGLGNTITIRRFRREPWTVTDFIKNKTASYELMALIWLAMQYELNIILSGGTASGKTSFLNVCIPFIQPNHRVISIEDTREITLPNFMHWVPMSTREPNAEGKGAVTMLDLLVNSLRMRPDRIIIGEIRRQKEAEVMFEAMHTGHSVYTTLHANTADETISRLTNPPISIPSSMLESVHLNIVMFRNRRLGLRRVLEVAEFVPEKRGAEDFIKANTIFRWKPSTDSIEQQNESIRLYDELSLHTGFTKDEIEKDIKKKKEILEWMVKNNISSIQKVGLVVANYYSDEDEVYKYVKNNKIPDWLK
ncbi:MAG: ATPase, T2SS/T4P/T4SS family [Candidatus Diapherotrites archaeon]|nr:ATPase, T2SS/T4P/T4SS family [Candidatus Diapherotrites archaeon]